MGNKKFAGRGMHELYLPATKQGYKNKRYRKDCQYYNPTSKWCQKIFSPCVGPTICRKHQVIEKHRTGNSLPGKKVVLKNVGEGTIISVSEELSTIQFHDRKVQIKTIELKSNSDN